ncbi:MAG TPA: hypothetical protein VGL97_16915 [Bryobacteraceae bacterium]
MRSVAKLAGFFEFTPSPWKTEGWTETKTGARLLTRDAEGIWSAKARELRLVKTQRHIGKRLRSQKSSGTGKADGREPGGWLDLGAYSRSYRGWSLPMLVIYQPYLFGCVVNSPIREAIHSKHNSRLKAEWIDVVQKAATIKIPGALAPGRVISHSYSECLVHIGFQIVSMSRALDNNEDVLEVEPWLSLIRNESDYVDFGGVHSMTKSFFEYYSAPAGRPWTREECESFFDNDNNFFVFDSRIGVEMEILRPACIGHGSVFSLKALGATAA